MSRQEMIDALAALGFDVSKINDAVPDEVLAEMLSWVEPPADEAPAKAAMDEVVPEEERPAPVEVPEEEKVEQYDDMPREEMLAALISKGYAEADLQGLSDMDLKALYDQEFPPAAPVEPPMQQMSERRRKLPRPSRTVRVFAERHIQRIVDAAVNQAVKGINLRLGATRRQVSEHDQNMKRANVRKFCESLVEQGKLLPAEFEGTLDRLFRADHLRTVRTFAENGKQVAKTELQLQMDELEKRPTILSFAERMKQPAGTLDTEVAKVRSHFQAFSENYAKNGHTEEKMIKAFELARKKNPRLTANDFVNGQS